MHGGAGQAEAPEEEASEAAEEEVEEEEDDDVGHVRKLCDGCRHTYAAGQAIAVAASGTARVHQLLHEAATHHVGAALAQGDDSGAAHFLFHGFLHFHGFLIRPSNWVFSGFYHPGLCFFRLKGEELGREWMEELV